MGRKMADDFAEMFDVPEEAASPPPAEVPADPPAQQEPVAEQVSEPPQGIVAQQPPAPEPKPDHTVPLPKYLDTRDELKEAKRKLAEYEARQQQQPKAPDPIDDPDGYAAYHEQRMSQALTAQKFQMSDVMAKQVHGAEKVEAAQNWAVERAQADPTFAAQYMQEAHPIDWIVRQHQRDAIVSAIPTDVGSLEELIEREVAKRMQPASQQAAPAAGTQQATYQPAAPSKSLVDVPSGGGVTSVPMGPTAGFDAVFER